MALVLELFSEYLFSVINTYLLFILNVFIYRQGYAGNAFRDILWNTSAVSSLFIGAYCWNATVCTPTIQGKSFLLFRLYVIHYME